MSIFPKKKTQKPTIWASSESLEAIYPLWNLFPVVLKWYQTWIESYNTLLPSIFITGVHPPSPHPNSPRWQKTETSVEFKLRVKAWLICDLSNKAEISKKERLMNFLDFLIDARLRTLLLRGAFGINILLPLSRKELIVDSSTSVRFHCGM